MILEIDNVELYFSGKKILGGVYLKAETGQITGLLGSNGSGKSCLLSIIFGSLKPKYGLLRIDNKPILKPYFKTGKIGYLSQEHFLPERVKIKTIFKLYNANWQEFLRNFPDFKPTIEKRTTDLSFGEQRLIESFIIITGNYKVVLLDEPFSHLSPIHITKIKELILSEKKDKIIIISDHKYEEILSISDSLYLLKEGNTIKIEGENNLYDYNYLNMKVE